MGIIQLEDVHYTYPDNTVALNKIQLDIPRGKRIVFLGENGSGKSTLFFLLNGIVQPDSGVYYFDGHPVNYQKKHRNHLFKHIGFVFQDPDVQLFASTVYRDLSFGPKNMGLSDAEVDRRVNEAMKQTDISHLQAKPPHFLSYGQKKRVAVAGILAMDPNVLLMDEPFAWLDVHHQDAMYAMLSQLHNSGKTIIVSTHDPEFAWGWADYIYILKEGNIIANGSASAIFNDRAMLSSAGLSTPFLIQVAQKCGLSPWPRTKQELLERLS